ncbi:hypothetical protein A5819_000953 [Enterococcus sp. 7E2_DIV0204]|uniref:hypothetical protein n=1 Tax=unclassified Enterococcus TaxID=2608891 RepID=UPI000A33B364|nr:MULTISPECIES: hypothetical protein [unclassified Enterococcus]OTN88472.1 hypothetical protein A5819_000953 [Enterococcus sp. 7E2_DIV0204]OTP50941.1 hypothetical protein A5884_000127 [Enterococcus sp. 7D2_DIV0200]
MGLFGDFMKAAAKEVANELLNAQQNEQEKKEQVERTEAQAMMSQLSSDEIIQVINRPNTKNEYFEAGTAEIERRIDAYDQLIEQYGKEAVEEYKKPLQELSLEELEKILGNQDEFEPELVLLAQLELDDRDIMRMKREILPWQR